MSIEIDVLSPPGCDINVQEKICSMCNADGNIRTAGRRIGHGEFLEDMTIEEAKRYLIALVIELDKGRSGKFDDAWCKEVDRKWSGLKEYEQAIKGIHFPISNYAKDGDEFWGMHTRGRLREDAVRFLLYYFSGCVILFDSKRQISEEEKTKPCI